MAHSSFVIPSFDVASVVDADSYPLHFSVRHRLVLAAVVAVAASAVASYVVALICVFTSLLQWYKSQLLQMNTHS